MILFALLIAAAPNQSMGTIAFPVSGNRECQQRFMRGMLALHSFMYDFAHQEFQAAIAADPNCAMARWGDSMSYHHPLWGEEDLAASKRALDEVVRPEKLPPKEQRYLEAARVLVGEGDHRSRQSAWLEATEKMRADFPNDDEVALQHALALLANSERLRNTERLMQSAAISMDVFQRKPKHPGAAHYLIHATDTPDHAILGLPAARQYAKTAPDASHALHMPSHIFVHLAMWKDVISSNEDSWAAAEKEVVSLKKKNDQRDWHSYSWLMGAHVARGQIKKAEELLKMLGELVTKEDGSDMRFAYSLMVRHLISSTAGWDRADALLAPIARPIALEPGEPAGSLGCALHAPGASGQTRPPVGLVASLRAAHTRAEAKMRKGDEQAVSRALAPTKELYAAMEAWGKMLPPEHRERGVRIEAAYLAIARAFAKKGPKDWEAAIAATQKLAELPEYLPGGPAFDTPPYQILGDVLLEAGRAKDALAAYDTALAKNPGHVRSMLGAARAAKAAGDREDAQERYAKLAAQWAEADADLPELAEVRSGAAMKMVVAQ